MTVLLWSDAHHCPRAPIRAQTSRFSLRPLVPMSSEPGHSIELRLRAAVESAPSGLLMVDPQGRIVLVNREIERLFGYSREELMGTSVDLLVPERFRSGHVGFRAEFVAAPRARAMGAGRDLFGLRKDGSEVPLEIGLRPVVTEEGMFVLSSIVDISARKVAEAERSRLEKELRQAQKMESLGTLAGGIAHDFNNILSGILAYAEFLEETIEEEEALADVKEVIQFSQRGKQLVERIMTFSRQKQASPRPISLEGPIHEVVRLLQRTVEPGIEVVSWIDPAAPRVLADPTGMHQVLMNLGLNAAQAIEAGGLVRFQVLPIYVTDSLARASPSLREGSYTLLQVKDTGSGMSPEVQARALEPFYTTREKEKGSGLGLAMVHGIVREHGGSLVIESTPGEGTEVRCYLPAVEDEEAIDEPGVSSKGRGRGQRVLYVDDEPSLARVGKRRLSALGYDPVAVTDSREALRLVEADPTEFDLVLTDFLMPRMNGIELAAAIHSLRPDLPIVLLSGHVADFSVEEVDRVGIRRTITKPVTAEVLAVTLAETLATKQ